VNSASTYGRKQATLHPSPLTPHPSPLTPHPSRPNPEPLTADASTATETLTAQRQPMAQRMRNCRDCLQRRPRRAWGCVGSSEEATSISGMVPGAGVAQSHVVDPFPASAGASRSHCFSFPLLSPFAFPFPAPFGASPSSPGLYSFLPRP
jgi:hypothetical protein